ncbi:activating transcription factor 7-interacting protein 1 isoform X2 [Wyeomyia smithii]|uniref:activating transcription factor 7-interacting protein 1 isoform X2 n=1 Tax=Wyeomyia smithii TaxID=174621 RepID=UPI0024680E78|nr:activating transcription factor 7-interacting protein 1 isoform X2 [Wyeomyia smithii]
MMEVNQPIDALKLQNMNSVATVPNDDAAVDLPESLLDTALVKQNGTSNKTICSEVSMEIDESKELHDEDSMERLTYSEVDNEGDEGQIKEDINDNSDLAKSISDTLVNDIIHLNKNADCPEIVAVPDRLTKEDLSYAPPTVEDANIDDTLVELSTEGTTEIGEELDENLLLEGEDDNDIGDEPEVDECLLLEDTEMEEVPIQISNDDVASMQESVIQIEDSVLSTEKTEDETITDNSVIAIDESGLSILNTAAVDMGDVTVDESMRFIDEKEQEKVTNEEQLEPPQLTEPNEPPVLAMMEDMVADVSDNLKTDDKEECLVVPEQADEQIPMSCPSPEISDLIKFPDVDNIVENNVQDNAPETSTSVNEPIEVVSEEAGLIEDTTESTPAEDKTQLEEVDHVTDDISDLIDLNNCTIIPNEKSNLDDVDPEISDLIKFPNESVSKENYIPEKDNDDTEISDAQRIGEKCTDDVEKMVKTVADDASEIEKQKETDVSEKDESTDQQPVVTSRQALQAADEEDLLEMMEEPERMDPEDDDEENGDEDLDEHSSESGSAKQTQAEDEEDFEESDYVGLLEEDDVSGNAEDNETVDNDAGGVQADEEDLIIEPPPSKRRCSVDVRDSTEVMNEKMSGKEMELDSVGEKKEADKKTEGEKEKVLESTAQAEKAADEETKSEDAGTSMSTENIKEAGVQDHKTTEEDEISAENVCAKKAENDQETKEIELAPETISSDLEKQKQKEEPVVNINEVNKEKVSSDKVDLPEKTDIETETKSAVEEEKVTSTSENDAKSIPDEKEEESPKVETSSCKTLPDVDIKSKSIVDQDEVLVIDDDDEEPEKQPELLKTEDESASEEQMKEEKDSSLATTGKRPCPEDKLDEKEVKPESIKKMRLSEDDSKLEKLKDVAKVPKEEKKSALDSIQPLTLVLDPAPAEHLNEKKPVRLDFLDKFKKPLEKMERTDLEEFVLQKIVEGIAFKSAIAEMRTQLDSQDLLLQGYRQKVHDLNKQFKDLEMVHERVVKDLEKKNQHFITPVKITRAVGLQVSQPRFVPGNRPSVGSTSTTNSPKASTGRSAETTPASSPNRNTPQTNVQNRRSQIIRVPPVVTGSKTPVGQNTNRPNQQVATITKSSPVASVGTPNKTVSAVQTNMVTNNSPQQQQTGTVASATTTPTGAVPPLTRKRPLQKFTPMRPPLSITQQVQQQQQTRQMQEHLVRQQIQEVQTVQTVNATPGSQPQSPLSQSPQGSPLTRTPEPSPLGIAPARVPPIVMKKVGQQVKGTPTTMQIISRQTPSMVSSASSATMDNSLIDLTDEDDAPKPTTAVVASTASVVPKPPITILNGQQQQYVQRQGGSMPPLVVINQQRVVNRATIQQRPIANGTVNTVTNRSMVIQKPGAVANGFPRAIATQQMYKPRMPNGQIDVTRRIVSRATIRQQTAVSTTTFTHPAPLPQPGIQMSNPTWKQAPPRPSIRINNIETGIVISWTMDDLSEGHATIVSYQIYAYQETTAPPSMDMWRHVGDVKAMLLPMAVTLTQFQEGQRYHFAVRAVDEHQRVGQFSPPRTWNESTPAKA